MVCIIISKFQKRIIFKSENFIQSTILKLIYLEKTNLIYHKSTKQIIEILHINIIILWSHDLVT